jgi:hypothetical protein
MERNYFVFNKGQISRNLGYVTNLGLCCPFCDSYVGGKRTLPHICVIKKFLDSKDDDLDSVTTGIVATRLFVVKQKFTPSLTPSDWCKTLNEVVEVIDDSGKTYSKDEFGSFIKGCILADEYDKALFRSEALGEEE